MNDDKNPTEQDKGNLPRMQTGMKTSKNQLLNLGRYQESRIRPFSDAG